MGHRSGRRTASGCLAAAPGADQGARPPARGSGPSAREEPPTASPRRRRPTRFGSAPWWTARSHASSRASRCASRRRSSLSMHARSASPPTSMKAAPIARASAPSGRADHLCDTGDLAGEALARAADCDEDGREPTGGEPGDDRSQVGRVRDGADARQPQGDRDSGDLDGATRLPRETVAQRSDEEIPSREGDHGIVDPGQPERPCERTRRSAADGGDGQPERRARARPASRHRGRA